LNDDGLDEFRRRLEARVDDCWDRLDDVVSELTVLHAVGRDEVVSRVLAVLERERAREPEH
jgi:hypothetical protein